MDLLRILDASDFMPRHTCGQWSESLITIAQMSDAAIATAYFFIPVSLYWLWLYRKGGWRGSWILLLFCAFIVLCGMTHVCQVLAFHWPAYRFFTIVSFLTAIASLTTAVFLPWMIQEAIRSPGLGDVVREMADVNHDRLRLESDLGVERRLRSTMELQASADRAKIEELERTLEQARRAAEAKGNEAICAAVQTVSQITPSGK